MSSSSNRNPKDLRDLIEKSKNEHEFVDIEETLIKLRNIPNDDKTEMGLLRSRIEEQSRLIMILKQRGDEYIRKNMAMEKINKEYLESIDKYNFEIKSLEKKCDLLNSRFNDLAENHQELIKIKDEYKKSNVVLVDENQKLKIELNKYKTNQDMKDGEFLNQINELKNELANKDNTVSELSELLFKQKLNYEDILSKTENEFNSRVKDYESKINYYEDTISSMNNMIKDCENELKNLNAKNEAKLKDVSKERDELLELTIQRGKLLQEKQHENQKLTERVNELDKLVTQLKERFDLESEKVNANQLIQKLRYDLNQMETRLRELQMEYDAYKKHSLSLLEREKELNAKLRFLVS